MSNNGIKPGEQTTMTQTKFLGSKNNSLRTKRTDISRAMFCPCESDNPLDLQSP